MGADPLLESLEELLRTKPQEPDEQQLRAAVAVLLLQLVRVDGEIRHDEHLALGRTLQRVLGLTEAQADALARRGEEDAAHGVLFRDLVEVLARCSPDVKKKVVHALWRVAYADAELAGQEEYLVRKVSEHLGLDTADLIETKLRARDEFLKDGL
jgi:uncharacterized tellurite resistance protein B-like protein